MMLCTSASGIAVVAAWVAARPSVPSQGTDGGFQSYVQAFFAVAGGLWTSTNVEFAVVMGLLTVGCALVAIARAPLPSCPPSSIDHPVATDVERLRALILRRRPVSDSALPWLGILVWASCAFLLIASSRAETDVFVGLGSRYASIPALMVSAVGALALMTATTPGLRKAALPAALLAALGIAGATGIHRDIHSRYDAIELSAVAARLGVPDLVPESPIATDRLTSAAAAGAYPYNRLFDHECNGLGLGDGVDSGAFSRLSGPPTAEVIARTVRQGDSGTLYTGAIDRTVENGGTRLDGWALIGGQPAECVLLLADDTVVGTGVTELPRGDLSPSFGIHSGLGWRAVAPAGLDPDDITVLVGRSGHSYVLPRGEGD